MPRGIYKRTEKHKEIVRQNGKKHTHHTEVVRKKIGKGLKKAYKEGRKERPFDKKWQAKMIKARKTPKRENHYNWKGGITTYERKLYLNNRRRARKMNAEGSHTFGEWELLKRQYGYTCPHCGKKEPEIVLTEDHIIPLSKGGSDYIENIQPLCRRGNSEKYTKIKKY